MHSVIQNADVKIYENDERYQLDATIVIYYHKYLYMFRASLCPYSGVQHTTCTPEDGHIDARNM